MKILVCEFNGLGEKGIENAMTKKGYEVVKFNRKCDNYDTDLNYLNNLSKLIEDTSPDIVFSINFLPIVSKVCNVYRIAYYSWVYDCPEMHLYSKAMYNDVNRIFIFDKIMYERLKVKSPDTIYYLPLATEPVEDFDNWITEYEKQRFSHDITFIGSLYNEEKRQYHQLDTMPEYYKGYIEGLAEAQINVFGYNFIMDSMSDEFVRDIKNRLGYAAIDDYEVNDREVIADHYIGMYASSLDRIRTLQIIANVHKVSIYTDSDISMLDNIECCGIADSITMTPKIYHMSKINLNITMKPIQSGIPLRVFDVLGSQGFLISNYQPEIAEYFTIGEDLVVYDSMNDLRDKIIYYLENEDERKRISYNGYKKVKELYTYENMLSLMFEEID